MNWQQYKEQVKSDAYCFIDEYLAYNGGSFEQCFDEMFDDDGVTGNGSGSYTMNSIKAKKLVSELLWDDEALSCIKEIGVNGWPTDAEKADVTARCAALYEVYEEVEDYFNERKDDLYGD